MLNDFYTFLVEQLYEFYLGRAPDESGREHWVGRLEAGVSLEELASVFAESDEAQNREPGPLPEPDPMPEPEPDPIPEPEPEPDPEALLRAESPIVDGNGLGILLGDLAFLEGQQVVVSGVTDNTVATTNVTRGGVLITDGQFDALTVIEGFEFGPAPEPVPVPQDVLREDSPIVDGNGLGILLGDLAFLDDQQVVVSGVTDNTVATTNVTRGGVLITDGQYDALTVVDSFEFSSEPLPASEEALREDSPIVDGNGFGILIGDLAFLDGQQVVVSGVTDNTVATTNVTNAGVLITDGQYDALTIVDSFAF
ncbi:MAG: DUF4214 domain-containing protein [Pseudomonadota bacterium]